MGRLVLLQEHLVHAAHGLLGVQNQGVEGEGVPDVPVQLELGPHSVAQLVRPDVAFGVLPVEPSRKLVDLSVAFDYGVRNRRAMVYRVLQAFGCSRVFKDPDGGPFGVYIN